MQSRVRSRSKHIRPTYVRPSSPSTTTRRPESSPRLATTSARRSEAAAVGGRAVACAAIAAPSSAPSRSSRPTAPAYAPSWSSGISRTDPDSKIARPSATVASAGSSLPRTVTTSPAVRSRRSATVMFTVLLTGICAGAGAALADPECTGGREAGRLLERLVAQPRAQLIGARARRRERHEGRRHVGLEPGPLARAGPQHLDVRDPAAPVRARDLERRRGVDVRRPGDVAHLHLDDALLGRVHRR